MLMTLGIDCANADDARHMHKSKPADADDARPQLRPS